MARIAAPKAVSLKPKSWEEVPPRRAPATPAAPIIEFIRPLQRYISGFLSTTWRVEPTYKKAQAQATRNMLGMM
jgi:hypothetical protein